MSRLQKVIVLIFGLLDIGVLIFLGNMIIWQFMTPAPEPPPTLPSQIAPCPQIILDTLPQTFQPAVAWDQQLHITLHTTYTTTEVPTDSAQHLWTALDAVATSLHAGCPAPYTVTLSITAHSISETQHHIARVKGQDILDWTIGNLSSETLAAKAAYRQVDTAVLLTPDTQNKIYVPPK